MVDHGPIGIFLFIHYCTICYIGFLREFENDLGVAAIPCELVTEGDTQDYYYYYYYHRKATRI